MFRLLKASEIDVRVSTVNEKGVTLLLYKDARVDCKILDETVGAFNWARRYQTIGDNLYCEISIYDPGKNEWVSKQDVGTPTITEAVKSVASDSFKRAAVSWGIGRELYSAPFIWIPAEKVNIQKRGDKYVCFDKFKVLDISYNEEREISGLTIALEDGSLAFKKGEQKTYKSITEEQQEQLRFELIRTQVPMESVLSRYGVSSKEELTEQTFRKAMSALKKTPSAVPAA